MPMGYKKEPKCPEIPAQKPGGGGSGNLNPILPAFFTVIGLRKVLVASKAISSFA